MRDNTFDYLWEQIHLIFGIPAPKDGRKTVCKRKVQNIPDEAAPWIVEQFEQMDAKPRNMILAIRTLWQRWQEDNPTRMRREEHSCPYCIPGSPGKMLVLRRQKGTENWTECVVPCGHCRTEGWRVGDVGYGITWYHCPGGRVPRDLWPLLYPNLDGADRAFHNGAPFHELVQARRFDTGARGGPRLNGESDDFTRKGQGEGAA